MMLSPCFVLSRSPLRNTGQRRKDVEASPYINQPIAVAAVLAVEAGVNDGPTLLAAILHDTVEDTETTVQELEDAFGPEVAALVKEMSDDKSLPRATRKELQIEHAATASPKAKRLKVADKICNIRDVADHPPPSWSLDRRREYLDWAERVARACRGAEPRLDAVLDRVLTEARARLRVGA